LCLRKGVAERSADGYRNYNSRMQFPHAIPASEHPRIYVDSSSTGVHTGLHAGYWKSAHENLRCCPWQSLGAIIPRQV
jgi:hypothetical protein